MTAQRRAERLQDVPIAITAVSSAKLSASGVRSSDDLKIAVPGLNLSRQTGASLIFLRGVGTAGGQAAQEGAVATFIDGVYLPSPSGATMSLSNIERVEVLKGPQGTLYGRNATGGAINVITKSPSFRTGVAAQLGYGNHDTIEANFYGTTGLTDKIAVDLAAYYRNQRDGFGKNVFTGNDFMRGKDAVVRSKLLFTPTEDTTITIGGDYAYYKGSEGLGQRGTDSSNLVNGKVGYTGRFYDISLENDPYLTFKGGGVSATIEQGFGDVKLTSITAYRSLKVDSITEADGTELQVLGLHLVEKNRQFSQEVRLGNDGERFTWILGGFYLKSRSGYDPFDIFGAGLAGQGLRELRIDDSFQRTTSLAAFGQLTWHIGSATNLTVGGRYTRDKRSYHGALSGDVIGVGFVPLAASNAFDSSKTFKKPSWRLSLDHKFSPDVMGYVSYNRGFKSGIYNVTSPGAPPVNPEQLDAYETGLKTTLFDNRLRLNSAVYYYKYKNIQLISQVGATQLLLNAARAKIYGLDVDFDAAITGRFSINGGFAYIHGRYGEFPNAPYYTPNVPPAVGNSVVARSGKGNRTVQTPDFSGTVAASYRVPVGENELSFNLSYVYNDGYDFTPDNSLKQKAYSLVNAETVLSLADGRYNVRVWGRNLFQEHYLFSGFQGEVGNTVVAATGRTFGVSVGVKY